MSELIFNDPRDYILLEYQLRKTRRAGYSLRAFARDLKFSPSSLNDFLKGRVGMSETRIHHLSKTLNWNSMREEYFKDLVFSKFAKDKPVRHASRMKVKIKIKENKTYLNVEQCKALSNWYNFVMLELFELNDHISAREITEILNISLTEAQTAIKNLLKVEAISLTDNGYKPTQNTRLIGDDAPSDTIKNYHQQILQQAQLALFSKSMHERESHSLIFSVRDEDKAKMNTEIRKALFEIVNKYTVDIKPDSVQMMTFQSFQIYKKANSYE